MWSASADILVPTVTDEITEELLKQPDCKLKLITANFGNGVDNIDVVAAHARGITVTNTPKVLTEDTADMTMALILARAAAADRGASIFTEGKNWPGWSPTWMLGHRIGGKRLGIIGMGRIGQAVARRARAFGLQIHYHNRRPVAPRIADESGATYWESLDQMLARMDMISVKSPAYPRDFSFALGTAVETRSASDADIVQYRARRSNRRRHPTRPLEAGEIGGAGLDVYENEAAVSPKLVGREGRQGNAAAAYGLATSKAASRWARRSSSTSEPSSTITSRRTACFQACCEALR